MKHFLLCLLISVNSISVNAAICKLKDGRIGNVKVTDTLEVFDSTKCRLRLIGKEGNPVNYDKEKIEFIVMGNDTINYKNFKCKKPSEYAAHSGDTSDSAYRKFGDRGSFEIGGGIAFASTMTENQSQTIFELAPILRYSFVNNMFVGPMISLSTFSTEYSTSSHLLAGIDFGCNISISKISSLLFGYSPSFATQNYHYVSGSFQSSSSQSGYGGKAFGGFKFIIQKHIGTNIQLSWHHSNIEMSVIMLGLTITGLIY